MYLSFTPAAADAISSSNPRVIDDARARKLSNDLKRCTYYETCATYGLNVERVFQDGKDYLFSSILHSVVVSNNSSSLKHFELLNSTLFFCLLSYLLDINKGFLVLI